MQLEQVQAVTWAGERSFAMIGLYGHDSSGRWVLTREGRFEIPADAIVLRAVAPQTAMPTEPQAEPEPMVTQAPTSESTAAPSPTRRTELQSKSDKSTRRKA